MLSSEQAQQLEGLSADIATLTDTLSGMQRRIAELTSTMDDYSRSASVALMSGDAHTMSQRPLINLLPRGLDMMPTVCTRAPLHSLWEAGVQVVVPLLAGSNLSTSPEQGGLSLPAVRNAQQAAEQPSQAADSGSTARDASHSNGSGPVVRSIPQSVFMLSCCFDRPACACIY